MKIFAQNDCDWWIGESLEACKADYINQSGDSDCIDEDACEVTGEALDKLTFADLNENEEVIARRTFREQLAIEIAEGGVFPRMFASSEY